MAFENEIARAVVEIAKATGYDTLLLDGSPEGSCPDPSGWVEDNPLEPEDALVVCNHDAPGAYAMVRGAVRGRAGYVAMMASRKRSADLVAELAHDGYTDDELGTLHVPAGLNLGGRSPGEIALSVVSEIVADHHGRPGTPMRGTF